MTNIHLAANAQITQQKPLVSIYWDYQNIPSAKLAKDLRFFASLRGYVMKSKVYDNWDQQSKKAKVILKGLSFECINVSLNIKNAVDFNLSIDCCNEASSSSYPHTFIILSGDGYGEILLHKLREKDKKVIIFARKGNEWKNLKIADEFHFIDELTKLIEPYQLAA